MKVEAAATANTGVWVTFLGVVVPLHRARGHDDPGAARHEPSVPRPGRSRATTGFDETDAPYGPNEPLVRRRTGHRSEAGSR